MGKQTWSATRTATAMGLAWGFFTAALLSSFFFLSYFFSFGFAFVSALAPVGASCGRLMVGNCLCGLFQGILPHGLWWMDGEIHGVSGPAFCIAFCSVVEFRSRDRVAMMAWLANVIRRMGSGQEVTKDDRRRLDCGIRTTRRWSLQTIQEIQITQIRQRPAAITY